MLKSLSVKLGHILVLYGGWGLFAMSFLDSSLIPFPVVNDLALIVMATKRPAWWPLYALASTLGSVCGAYVLYGIARGGGKFFFRKTPPQAMARAQHWLERNDFVAVLVASILPPPAPYKLFVLTAGLLRVNALNFGLALLVAGCALRPSGGGLPAPQFGLGLPGRCNCDCWLGAAAAMVEKIRDKGYGTRDTG
jgi:membrane protein YqaA with SNARE-associated domain